MRIVVTGAAGFIGSHTCERLVERGHSVIGIDGFDRYLYSAKPKRANAERLMRSLDPARFAMVEADICDTETMNATIGREGVEVVLHLAALAGVRPSLREPMRYVRTNLRGTGVILEACRMHGVDRLVFASSSSVYGAKGAGADLREVQAFREDDPCLRPASPYAATKRSGELMCSTYRDLFGIGISSLRFFTVYGPRQRPDMAIHKFVKAIAGGEAITLFGDGTSRRDYTYVDDIVSGTVAACERIRAGAYNIYNLGGTQTTGLRELVAVIEETLGREADIQWQPMQPGDVPITFADITNARRDLDYAPTTAVAEGVARFWEWYQAQNADTDRG